MISILLVEDHAYVADAIGGLLDTYGEFRLAAHARSAEEALELLPGAQVDLLLVDLALPEMNGIDLVACLRQSYPGLPCIILSAHREPGYVRRSLEAGARGFITKENPLTIPEGIRQVMAGEIYLSEDLRGEYIETAANGPAQ